MAKEQKKSSMRESTLSNIGSFLYDEGFKPCQITKAGILELVNLISDYYEEGVHLYPEVVITNDFNIFRTIPNRHFVIKETGLDIGGFKNAIKLCAPLATNGWIIFIEVKDDKIRFGLISTEMTETSLSLYKQAIENNINEDHDTLAYVRNLGQKVVELVGLKSRLVISLTLDDEKNILNNEISKLAQVISSGCIEDYKNKIEAFFEKVLNEAIKTGHGNLVGIVDDNEDTISKLKEVLKDGIYLRESIDIGNYVKMAEEEKTNETSVALKAFASILISMLNHDGITIISNKAKVLGYHLFVKNNAEEQELIGGARTRAFEAMKKLNLNACFYRSQDGNIKYYNHE